MIKKWIPLWVIPIGVVLAVGTVWLRLWMVETTYEINQVSRMIANSRESKEKLELELARLRSPRRLEKLAKRKFKLKPPTAHQIVYLRKESW